MPPNKRTTVCLILAPAILLLFPKLALAGFTDVSAEIGITYQHSLKTDPVNTHGGAAVLDVNGDGHSDLIFARYQKAPLLYVNDGTGSFTDETAARGLASAIDASAFGAADFDNDGDQDIYMSVHQGNRFYLFINDGTGTFGEDAVSRGAALNVVDTPHKGFSVGVVDYDLDGFLDIYVSEWGVTLSSEFAEHSALLRNRGAEAPGHFELVTEEAGLTQPVRTNTQHGFASAWADFDGDSWPDLAMIVDYGKSQMYWNDGDGTFTRTTAASGVGFDENGMGVAVADYDGDGLLDFYVTSVYDEFSNLKDGSNTGNKLYKNMGNRNFQEVAVPSGVSRTGWGWGTAFLDSDNDGDFDLVATNGWHQSEGADRNTTPFVDAASDPTTFFLNNGDGTFSDRTLSSGIADNRYGKSVLVLDWDSDGDEDVVVVNSFSNPIFYENDAAEGSNKWIRLTLEGNISNRDGIGTVVTVVQGEKRSMLNYNPSNAFIGQREGVLHFGLGDAGSSVESLVVKWPTGLVQVLENVSTNQKLHLVEPEDAPTPPLFSKQPIASEAYGFGDELVLEVETIGNPQPIVLWEKDGITLEGQNESRLRLKRLAPFDQGVYRARAVNAGGASYSQSVSVSLEVDLESHSVARWWNEFMLEAIRKDFPDPTKHSRNLFHVSSAMWDAFWSYEGEGWTRAQPMFHEETPDVPSLETDRLNAQAEAISHAAYTVLYQRYKDTPGANRSLAGFRWLMSQLGFDPDNLSLEGASPSAAGNRIGTAVLEKSLEDGSNEANKYLDTSSYESVNPPLVLELPGSNMTDLNRWQPLAFDFAISQNGIPLGALVQSFLGVNWREVSTFAMAKPTHNTIAFDPGPPPQWDSETHDEFVDSAIEVIRYSSYLDPADETMIDISPGALLNNPLGENSGTGRKLNPITGKPYESNLVKRADYGRILAEYWADGPASETPPGHWNTLHNEISDYPDFERRYMGKGEPLAELEWDIRAYLALNGGMHDAAVAAWGLKAQYDYSRPISMIRTLAVLGQASDPSLPSYNELGIKLVPGLVELVTAESTAEGRRHEGLSGSIGKIAIKAWAGEPEDYHAEVGGVSWILAENWFPYQRGTFVTPAFAAYVSGHSTFSRAGAEVMTLLTGSPYFPGGIGEFLFEQGEYLEFEYGPSDDVTLQWATYYDAADQAGLSRLYGGIHVRADDFVGRTLGARIGVESFLRAHQQRNANLENTGLIRQIRHVTDRESQSIPLITIHSEGKPLSQRVLHGGSLRDLQEEDGIYFEFSKESESRGVGAGDLGLVGVGPLLGTEIGFTMAEGETASVELRMDAIEPVLVLATAEANRMTQGVSGVELRVFFRDEDGTEREVASNDDWRSSDVASQIEVLGYREGGSEQLGDNDAAVTFTAESVTYRVELEILEGDGEVILSLKGQGWRPFPSTQ